MYFVQQKCNWRRRSAALVAKIATFCTNKISHAVPENLSHQLHYSYKNSTACPATVKLQDNSLINRKISNNTNRATTAKVVQQQYCCTTYNNRA
jgi:hypothetical protein